ELGQPVHAFDPDRLRGPLVVRRARPGERLTPLDGVDRGLDPQAMAICDARGPVSLAAGMGGAHSEMTPESTAVLLEAAHWEPVMVARTARRHKLPSEAAKRWERGVDPTLPLVALQRAVDLLVAHAGGQVDERIGDIAQVTPPAPVTIAANLPARTAGVPYPPERVVEVLRDIGCTVAVDAARLTVTPPPGRPDVVEPDDRAEGVTRVGGYDRVRSVLPVAAPGSGLTARERRRGTVGRPLAAAGYVEALSYPNVSDRVW